MAPIDSTRMSAFETLMWRIRQDPMLSTNIANLTLMDRPPNLSVLRSRMEQATLVVPRLRCRVVESPGGLAPPAWREDPDFDITRHVRTEELPAPGDLATLMAVTADLANRPFDMDRPLWEFVVLTGLVNERTGKPTRAAMVQRIDHTITDGEGGLRMSLAFLDFDRESSRRPTRSDLPDPTSLDPGAAAHPLMEVVDSIRFQAMRGMDRTRNAFESLTSEDLHPSNWRRLGGETLEFVRSLFRQIHLVDHRESPLWTQRGESRATRILDLDFTRLRAASRAHGVSVNDVFVSGAAAAAGAYHARCGVPVANLRASMPVSRRQGNSATQNMFAPTMSRVPTSPELSPTERLRQVSAILAVTRKDRMSDLMEPLAGAVFRLPIPILVQAGRRVAASVDMVTSNVRAAPVPMYFAGARMDGNYPFGPLIGAAFNVTMMSYAGRADMGLHVDASAVTDPDLLRDCLSEAYAELMSTSA